MNILEVKNIYKTYALHGGFFASTVDRVQALENVSCTVEKGDCFGIVGKSGSGKSTLSRVILGQDIYDKGSIKYTPLEIDPCNCKIHQLRNYRDEVKIIFQDPARSLNPRVKIGTQLITSLCCSNRINNKNIHSFNGLSKKEKYNFAFEQSCVMLRKIGLPENTMQRYPPYFSGGQRQRLAIVRALIHKPTLLICDEITASLDVSTHRTLLELLLELKQELNLTIIFIAHDIALVFYFCNKIAVMDEGHIVESNISSHVIKNPKSDITKQLLAATPRMYK